MQIPFTIKCRTHTEFIKPKWFNKVQTLFFRFTNQENYVIRFSVKMQPQLSLFH